MTKIVAGIDFSHYPFALAYLDRLGFAEADVRLVHVVESLMLDKSFPDLGPTHPITVIMAEHLRQGELELDKAEALLKTSRYQVGRETHQGDPARVLIERASDVHADIIAVGSARKGAWASLFFGSVTKALTSSAEQSILVAKSAPRSKDGLTAVLAVDHSAYGNACIDRFISWNARGVQRVSIVTGTLSTSLGVEQQVDGLDRLDSAIEADIEARNAAICKRLQELGMDCDHRVVHGHANEAIESTMNETAADLLIMGARGHGYWDRLRLGSVSHHQVVASPHNVLVVRV